MNDADPVKVRMLIDMGFADERARRALKHFRNDMDLAMDYLIHTPIEHDANLNTNHENQSNLNNHSVSIIYNNIVYYSLNQMTIQL